MGKRFGGTLTLGLEGSRPRVVLSRRDCLKKPVRHRSRPAATIRSSWIPQIEAAIRKSSDYFFRVQYPEGYWWAELESNVTITSEYVMLTRLLGIPIAEKRSGIVKYLLRHQNENGSWGLYYGDGGELSTTIEAYFALKLLGEDPGSEPLAKARAFILQHGGIEASRVFTKIWLAQFDQYDWHKVPSMPVELVLLPPEFYFNVYEFSSWARGTAVPLSIVLCIRPKFRLPDSLCASGAFRPGAWQKTGFPDKQALFCLRPYCKNT